METILQFGAGRFLRAFVDRFVQQANDSGQNVGQVVVVQSTAGSRAELIGKEGFHVVVRGYENGDLVDRVEPVKSVSRALVAAESWPAVLELAASPDLRTIVSNATEAGYVLDDDDTMALLAQTRTPPRTLPGKLTQVLWTRYQTGLPAPVLLPCELIERNAQQLAALVRLQAERWELPEAFRTWVTERCLWLNNLVDCMVTPPPADHPLTAKDPLFTSAEPYALWAIEKPAGREVPLFTHPAIRVVGDLGPFYLRKVRILNGLHSAMVAKFLPAGFETVQDVLRNPAAVRWVRALLFEEIVPTIAYRVEEVAAFADETFDRLRNPFMRHRLGDIALNHAAKAQVRLKPTHDEYVKLFGTTPKKLAEALAWTPAHR